MANTQRETGNGPALMEMLARWFVLPYQQMLCTEKCSLVRARPYPIAKIGPPTIKKSQSKWRDTEVRAAHWLIMLAEKKPHKGLFWTIAEVWAHGLAHAIGSSSCATKSTGNITMRTWTRKTPTPIKILPVKTGGVDPTILKPRA
ncbi:hypothetical protein MMC16_004814 [Acarospora aff. strigata]|nr:hypothetical protein [Acarospora aff. strigata]